MKLYLVSNACYSDGGPLAIFSTEEKAKAFIEIYNSASRYAEAYVEPYELDASPADNIGSIYVTASISITTFEIKIASIVLITARNCTDYDFSPRLRLVQDIIVMSSVLKLAGEETALEKVRHICTDIARQYKATGILGA